MAAQAQPGGKPYRAVGTEPFWSLTIDARTMRLAEPGRRDTVVARPLARPRLNGERYVARGMSVDVTHARCSDGMSDRKYRDTVTVRTGRRTLKGCGGAIAEAKTGLANTRWTIWQVNGQAIQTYQPLTVEFAFDRIQGKLCNGFSGTYVLDGTRLRVDDVAATRMACAGPAGVVERTLFSMWRAPVTAVISRWDTLTLGGQGNTVTLRPARR